jgi:hypothetical protein
VQRNTWMPNVAWEATVLPDPLVELSVHKRRTLFRIANGDDRSGIHDPADVKRLQSLALIEDEGLFIHMTALGRRRVEGLGSR